MNKFLKTLSAFVLAAMMAMLAACTDGANTVTLEKARDMQAQAAAQAAAQAQAQEAAKTQAKYIAAEKEMDTLAFTTVSQGKFMSKNNCAVPPEGFSASSAKKNFPDKAFDFYKAACIKHVVAAYNAQHPTRAVAKKVPEQKLAAKKAAEQKRLAEAKKKAKPVKPAAAHKAERRMT